MHEPPRDAGHPVGGADEAGFMIATGRRPGAKR